jgi:hypothetical protein
MLAVFMSTPRASDLHQHFRTLAVTVPKRSFSAARLVFQV